ncbi:PAS domain S-box protein [Oscillatoriales cyanobacterium LEGE 11467]|uniref:histidine kinase n=1 Tax=Zarconia navalis LEGE 11467 TaxID=1828826 RepID=A0A928VYK7_9CYAN|nr:PAS domain S-box protein [Zarconia navalis]MBE9041192.1 PAS domain S-box protein [Zarconia navalis LEGE 11467]
MKFRFFSHITASLATLIVLGAVSILERQERTRFQTAYRVNVLNKLHAVEAALEAQIDRNLALSRGLVAYISTHPDIDEAQFDRLARVLVTQQPDVESLNLVRAGSKEGSPGYTYSPNDRPFDWQAIDLDRSASIARTIESRNSIVEPPIALDDGRSIVIERSPIFITPPGAPPESGTYWGTVSLAVDLTSVLQAVGALNPLTSLKYSLRDSNGSPDREVFAGDGAIFQQDPTIVNVDLPQGYWQLAAVPKTGWIYQSPVLWWLRGGGGLLALLVGFSAFKGLDNPRQQRDALERETIDLREKEALYRELVENAHCAIVRLDAQSNITYLNPLTQRLLGYSEAELLGKPIRTILPPQINKATHPLLAAIEHSLFYPHDPIELDAKATCGNGKMLPMAWRGKAIVDPVGEVRGVVCIGKDISDRALAELELRASEAELRALLAAMTDLIFILDDRGYFIKVAPTSPDSVYRSLWDPTGRTLEDVVGPKRAEEFLEGIQKVLVTQMPHSFEYSLVLDGKEVWFGVNLSPMSADTVIWVARDISDRVRVEAQLRSAASELEQRVEKRAGEIQHANKQLQIEIVERMQIDEALRQSETREREKAQQLEQTLEKLQLTQAQLVHTEKMSGLGQLAAGMAHEINNPVGFIHGNLSHVRDYTQDLLDLLEIYQEEYPQENDRIEEWVEQIDLEFLKQDVFDTIASMESGTERIRTIILSLRNFSRLDESGLKQVDICEGLESTLLMLQHRLHRQSNLPEIQVIRELEDLPKVECYPSQLNQVFAHLMSNAIDALDENRHHWTDKPGDDDRFPRTAEPAICIRTQALEGDRVAISIADNGSGIPPEIQAKIFNPFFTTKAVGKGTGLGLSISYQIITETHQGTLTCLSQPDRGTQFKIEIPIRNFAASSCSVSSDKQ